MTVTLYPARAVLLKSQTNELKVLEVISLSHASHKKGVIELPAEVISAFLEGHCEKGIDSNINQIAYDGMKVIGDDDTKKPSSTAGELMDRSCSGPTGTIKLRYPKLALAISYENCEAQGKATLGYMVNAAFKADPLIGIEAKVDILSALIKIGANALLPGSAAAGKKFVKYIWPVIKDFMADEGKRLNDDIEKRKYYLEGGIALVMTVGANLGCETKWTKQIDAAQLTPAQKAEADGPLSAAANATLDILLEGKVYVKGKAWRVAFEAGLMVALGSAKEVGAAKLDFKLNLVEKGGKPVVNGGVEWNGLALLYASYAVFGVKDEDNDKGANKRRGDEFPQAPASKQATKVEGEIKKQDYDSQWVLIKPGKYPKDPKVPLDDYEKL